MVVVALVKGPKELVVVYRVMRVLELETVESLQTF